MIQEIIADFCDSTLVVSIARPEVRNAMTMEMAHDIARQFDRLDEDPGLRVAVLHGRGGTFCAGMDLKRFRDTGTRPLDAVRGGGGIAWKPPLKPVIAAVEGYALGLGFEMALACDLVVAASDAQFGLPEVKHGLIAAGGGAIRLPSRIPRAAAVEMLLTRRMAKAGRLHELGLVNQIVAPGDALLGALELAAEIAASSPDAVLLTKELVTLSRDWDESEAFDKQEPLVAEFLKTRLSP